MARVTPLHPRVCNAIPHRRRRQNRGWVLLKCRTHPPALPDAEEINSIPRPILPIFSHPLLIPASLLPEFRFRWNRARMISTHLPDEKKGEGSREEERGDGKIYEGRGDVLKGLEMRRRRV